MGGTTQFEQLGVWMAGKASGKSVDRLPVIDETEADRRTIEIYELATRKLRVGRVPLLFKALAAEKALLPCWHAMRPAIRVRAFEEAADDLRAEALQGGVGGVSRGPRGEQRVPRGVPQDMDPIELVPEDADGALAKVFRSIRAHLGLGLVPDDFRALGRWPKYLELAWSDARKRDGESGGAVKDLGAQAEDAARQLPIRVEMSAETLRAAGADLSRVRALVQRFRRALPALVLDLALFKVQLDGAESARESPFPIRWKYISSDEYTTVGLDEPVKLRAGDPKDLDEVSDEPH